MNQPRVSNLMSGKYDPSLLEVEVLAKALLVTGGWLGFDEATVVTKTGIAPRKAPEIGEPVRKTKPAPPSDQLPTVEQPRRRKGNS